MERELSLVKAFTQNPEQGNPAGVLLNADGLTAQQMIQIASELDFSESAFVLSSEIADFQLRFFTPTQEVDLCGHATIATFYELLNSGKITLTGEQITKTQESRAGVLPVTVHEDGLIVMTQPNPEYGEVVQDIVEVATLLSLSSQDLVEDLPLQVVSTGSPKLMIPVKNRESLFAIQPNLSGIAAYCQKHKMKGFYPFTFDTIEKDSDFHTRQFNPLGGIDEDPITGVAAGGLGAYAVKNKLLAKTKFVIEQGYIMNKPGKIYVEIGDQIKVGGYAVKYGSRTHSL